MYFDVSTLDPAARFAVTGCSYIGKPRDHTLLFVTRKMKSQLARLEGCEGCLVFCEKGLEIPEACRTRHCFIETDEPQMEYARLAVKIAAEDRKRERERKYRLTEGGYYLGENVTLGKDCVIEPNCRIGHDTVIGDRAFIGYGSCIYHARIGDDFACLDHTVVGTEAFYFAGETERFRIPSFGRVLIGRNVEMGCSVIIERGFNDDTVIGDHVKIDAGVCIGHDVSLGDNVFITCGADIAGLVQVGRDTYIGMNATVKQRLTVGDHALVGMGASVITNVKPETSVFGNPAKKFGV